MIPELDMRTVCSYATSTPYCEPPSEEQLTCGVVPLDSLPAAWWNWMWNQTNAAVDEAKTALTNMVCELNTVLNAAGIPAQSACLNQLYCAIDKIRQTVATASTAGAVKSSPDWGKVGIDANGIMTANGVGNTCCICSCIKQSNELVSSLNNFYADYTGNLATIGNNFTSVNNCTTALGTCVSCLNCCTTDLCTCVGTLNTNIGNLATCLNTVCTGIYNYIDDCIAAVNGMCIPILTRDDPAYGTCRGYLVVSNSLHSARYVNCICVCYDGCMIVCNQASIKCINTCRMDVGNIYGTFPLILTGCTAGTEASACPAICIRDCLSCARVLVKANCSAGSIQLLGRHNIYLDSYEGNVCLDGNVYACQDTIVGRCAKGTCWSIDQNGVACFTCIFVPGLAQATLLPVGVILPYVRHHNSGCLCLNKYWFFAEGQYLCKAAYPELYNIIGGKYGCNECCFRLPNLQDRTLQGASGFDVAACFGTKNAGLPNITGCLNFRGGQCTLDDFNTAFCKAVGAFASSQCCYATLLGEWYFFTVQGNASGGQGSTRSLACFNAACSCNIYGASSTVQPPAVLTSFIIKVKPGPLGV